MAYQLTYVSTATRAWPRADLLALLRQARAKNEALQISGVLLFRQGRFLQLLEGDREPVEGLYEAIRSDPRHKGVTLIWDAETPTRWFPGWSMGFRDLEEDPVTEPGLTDILRGPVDAPRFSHEVVLQLWTLLRPTKAEL